jgi:hypothetical protein
MAPMLAINIIKIIILQYVMSVDRPTEYMIDKDIMTILNIEEN